MSNEVSQFFLQVLYSDPVRKVSKFALRIHLALVVATLCLIGAYLFLSLLSYNELDVAWSHARGVNVAGTDTETVANIGGVLGAWIADLLHLFFGVGAWAILLWLMHEIYCVAYKKSTIFAFRAVAYLFLWACLDVLLYAYAIKDGVQPALNFAGIVGHECYVALNLLIGRIGAILFALFGFLVVIALLVDWETLYDWGSFRWRGIDLPKELPDAPKHDKNPIHGSFSYQVGSPVAHATTAELPTTNDESKTAHQSVLSSFLNKSGLRDVIRQDKSKPLDSEPVHLPPQQFEEVRATPNPPKPVKKRKKMTLLTDYGDGLVSERIIPEKSVMLNGKLDKKDVIKTEGYQTSPTDSFDSASFVNLSLQGGATTQKREPTITTQPSAVESVVSTYGNSLQVSQDVGVLQEEVEQHLTSSHDGSAYESHVDVSNQPHLVQKNQSQGELQHGGILFQYNDKEIHWRDVIGERLSPSDQTPPQTAPNVSPNYNPSGQINQPIGVPPQSTQPEFASPLTEATLPKPNKDAQVENNQVKPHDIDDTTKSRAMQTAAYRASLSPLPEFDLLDGKIEGQIGYTHEQLVQMAELLEIKLKEFGVVAQVANVIQGPVVTSFEVQLAAGVKASKVVGISQDLARSLSMPSLRVVEVIAGKPYIGIEIPNKHKQTVKLIELLNTTDYQNPNLQIALAMGKDIGGAPVIADLAKAPHMLVAGTTGSGKSVLVNAMLLSMLLKYTPDELRLILIDPKMLELSPYEDIPHLLTPVVTDMTEATSALSWCVGEMERRYQLMSLLKVRKLSEFNDKIRQAELSGTPILDPLWRPNDSVSVTSAPKLKPLPMIVVVADEFADMIMQVGKPAEELITRLAQKSRAAGIHLLLATQRPSVDVITGLIKANIPSRVGLLVKTKVDSRTILDAGGAEEMLGNGDMLFLAPGKNEPIRVHGAFVSNDEVDRVANAWRERGAPDYIDTVATTSFDAGESVGRSGGSGEGDEFYDQAVTIVLETGVTSISGLQRRLNIGYNRAANLVEAMEKNGVLSAPNNSGKRHIL